MFEYHPIAPRDDSFDTFMEMLDNTLGEIEYVDKYGVKIYKNINYVSINRKHTLFQKDIPQYVKEECDITKLDAIRLLFENNVAVMANGCSDLEWNQIFLHKAAVELPKQDYIDATHSRVVA
jgi:hypothetical protein